MTAHAIIHVDAADSHPRFHCDIGNRLIAVAVTNDPVTVYLTGTVAELVAWAHTVVDVAVDTEDEGDAA